MNTTSDKLNNLILMSALSVTLNYKYITVPLITVETMTFLARALMLAAVLTYHLTRSKDRLYLIETEDGKSLFLFTYYITLC